METKNNEFSASQAPQNLLRWVSSRWLKPLEKVRSNGKALGTLGDTQFKNPYDREWYKRTGNPPKSVFFQTEIVTFGDIHGDFCVLLACLKLFGLIDDNARWTGGKTLVVLCGDLLDNAGRSEQEPDSSLFSSNREEVDILQFVYNLNLASEKTGGNVAMVAGNHEIWRLGESDPQQRELLARYAGKQLKGWSGMSTMLRAFQNVIFLNRKGLGKHLLEKGYVRQFFAENVPMVIRCQGFFFMHAGALGTGKKLHSMETLNNCFYRFLTEVFVDKNIGGFWTSDGKKTRLGQCWSDVLQFSQDRTLGKANCNVPDRKGCCKDKTRMVQNFLLQLGLSPSNVKRGGVVIGHTVQSDIVPFCEGRQLWRLDIGMSKAFKTTENPLLRALGGMRIQQFPLEQPKTKKKPPAESGPPPTISCPSIYTAVYTEDLDPGARSKSSLVETFRGPDDTSVTSAESSDEQQLTLSNEDDNVDPELAEHMKSVILQNVMSKVGIQTGLDFSL